MNILALDIGTKTGYAILKGDCIISGTKKMQYNKKVPGLRFLDFRNWLINTINVHSIEKVYFEKVMRHIGTEAAHCYGGFVYHAAAICCENKITFEGVPVGTIKKFATSKGNATKKDMMNFAKLHNFNPVDDNEADALAILYVSLKLNDLLKNATTNRFFLAKEFYGTTTRGASPASGKSNGLQQKALLLGWENTNNIDKMREKLCK